MPTVATPITLLIHHTTSQPKRSSTGDRKMRSSRLKGAKSPGMMVACQNSVENDPHMKRCSSSVHFAATLFLLLGSISQCHAYVVTTVAPHRPSHTSIDSSLVSLRAARRRNKNRNNNVEVPPQNTVRRKAKGHRQTIKTRDATWDPTAQRNAMNQFTPRYQKYEQERLHGIQKDTSEAPVRPMKSKNAPTKEERNQLTSQIARLMSEETEQDDDDDDSLGDIADRQTVFAKLSDEDKSQATFAVSKATNPQASYLEPTRMGRAATKKGKITANVLETGQDTIRQYVKSMGQHQVLSKEDEAVLGKQIQTLSKWEEKRQHLEEKLLR